MAYGLRTITVSFFVNFGKNFRKIAGTVVPSSDKYLKWVVQ